MDECQKQFLLAEYTSISEHFRSYQMNRLNIVLLSIPAVGAIMLNCYEKEHQVRIISVVLLYILLCLLITLDSVFMKRLRNYTRRLAQIEKEFKVIGYSTQRINDVRNNHKDATTKSFRIIFHLINWTILFYSLLTLIKVREFVIKIFEFEKYVLDRIFPTIIVFLSLLFYVIIVKQLDTKRLSSSIDHNDKPDTQAVPLGKILKKITPAFLKAK
ncbi:hypothetical protein HUK80_02900 [Flavobacterium sp. MAH-1]|uniref:Uncharacterized protein n=1 Tax=Flavobacterium agri TaxID=2743471 RepID=A0A7Y9C4F4_9FLAO|nr:hypothetical protein [Flavobacterium agri]NUY79830.1 hypothetical protein [Flavobacterium agri]NYA69855.1 hypothetical protein [Flavobacterium agri]